MPFTVVWLPSAIQELADIWNKSPDRKALTDAANRIDQNLRLHSQTLGRPRKGYRIYAVPPLVVAYQVQPDDCLVRVVRVAHR